MTKAGSAPVIGMPAQMDPGSDLQYLNRSYVDAIAETGGIPTIIPMLAAAEAERFVAETLNGILLTGSKSDVDPSRYGAQRSTRCGPAQPLRDQMDSLLLETAFRRRIPVLAICYGIQSLNVFCGGSLIQDIPTCVDTSIQHNHPEASHKIEIDSGTILEQIAGGAEAVVNSTHHQAIDRVGENLTVIARAPDGMIESVVSTEEKNWILGVQWHPEKSFCRDSFSRRLFEYFLARCRAVRGSDEGSHS